MRVGSARDLRAWLAARRVRVGATVGLLAAVAAFLATTRVTITGQWMGLFLLESPSGRPFELKDDLRLGDASRLLHGVSFAWLRDAGPSRGALPRLELSWDEERGSGTVASLLADGVRVETYFSRYVQDDGNAPAGLFVGGARADVAAGAEQSESGMALRDRAGWHHVWCNVNEALRVGADGRLVYPGDWTFRGSRVLLRGAERVVLQSEHEVEVAHARLRMERFAYFSAGRTFFRLGVNVINLGEVPVALSYAYGDEPWVGVFGSSDGNIGWDEEGLVPVVTAISPRANRWGGILDTKSGLANFLSWEGSAPDVAYFANRAGAPRPAEYGTVLSGNAVFVGLEWRDRVLQPGETLPIRLTIGVAGRGPDGNPAAPPGAVNAP